MPSSKTVVDDDLRRRVAAFHPALAAGQFSATTVLHHFSPNPNYEAWRRRFLSAEPLPKFPLARIVAIAAAASKHLNPTSPIQRLDDIAYQHSQRNTPPLFGAGMIDRLPDSVFDELQRRKLTTGDVSGRVPHTAGGSVGRFGWRGQTKNLHEFVLGACAMELGLEAPLHAQPLDPLTVRFDSNGQCPPSGSGRLDISDEQCQALTQFVAHLPPPRQATPAEAVEAEIVARGEQQFEKVGCADCHVRQVADITGIYSDLLLHDMGEGLEDPLPASPPQAAMSGGGGYFGGGGSLLAAVSPEQRREWRTPPLWGLRDSAPYMHDGRATTFAEAVAWHGGEAAQSAKNFRRLEKEEKEEVLAFLNCLVAPTPESLWLENIVLVGDK